MTVEQSNVIDFVAHDPEEDVVILVMVESRDWGGAGELLPDLQEKLNTYLVYATRGQLGEDYPSAAGKPVRIELRSSNAPGERELEFLRGVVTRYLDPAGIKFAWKVIGRSSASAL